MIFGLFQESYNPIGLHIDGGFNFEDLIYVEDGEHLMNLIHDSYNEFGQNETAIIVRSNKRANLYNRSIRDKILNNENIISDYDYDLKMNELISLEGRYKALFNERAK